MNRIKALLAVILPAAFLAISAPAVAQQSDAGWYIGGSYGMTTFDLSGVPAGVSVDDSDSGFKIFGGFQFTKHWGAEVGYVDFGKVSVSGAGASGDLGVTAMTLAGTGTLPLGQNFALLGKVGMAMWDAEGSGSVVGNDGNDMFYGFGARYSFNKNMSVQAEYEVLDTEDDSVNMISIGLHYKF